MRFDAVTYGRMLRANRKLAGFRRADDFAKAVNEVAGYHAASRDVVYKIEQGRQEPTAGQMLAFASVTHPGYQAWSVVSTMLEFCEERREKPCR